jgi:hypothetical protein
MVDALQVIRYSLRDLWEEFVPLIALNVVWWLTLALPITAMYLLRAADLLLMLGVSLVLLLPLPVVSGAVSFVTNQISRGKFVGSATFFTGLRRYWSKSLVVALINIIVLVLVATNLQFYGLVLEGGWTKVAVSLWLVIGVFWLLVQVFWFPMILELQNEKVFLALRNALAMAIITPGFSLTLGVITVLIIALCVALTVPVLLFMVSFVLLIGNHATRSRLAFAQKKPYQPGMDQG